MGPSHLQWYYFVIHRVLEERQCLNITHQNAIKVIQALRFYVTGTILQFGSIIYSFSDNNDLVSMHLKNKGWWMTVANASIKIHKDEYTLL